jgi:hypothetical protein
VNAQTTNHSAPAAVSHLVFRATAVLPFWIAYVLTSPLGASRGDGRSQPRADGAWARAWAWDDGHQPAAGAVALVVWRTSSSMGVRAVAVNGAAVAALTAPRPALS